MKLFVFGCGYSASYFLRHHASSFTEIVATTRSIRPVKPIVGVKYAVFDGVQAEAEALAHIADSDAMLVSVPPNAHGDPVFAHFSGAIGSAAKLGKIVYLSTIGVYGDHKGEWVDETTQPVPKSARSIERLKAEENWLQLGRKTGKTVHILRLAGIYGPGQNALENLRQGTARRLVKTGQVFNRIHVEDIGRAIAAAFAHASSGDWNVSDSEPAPPQDVVSFAASLLGIDPPPEENFELAEMSPMARSFYGENKRVSNKRLREELGVELAYPSYREGIAALAQAIRQIGIPASGPDSAQKLG